MRDYSRGSFRSRTDDKSFGVLLNGPSRASMYCFFMVVVVGVMATFGYFSNSEMHRFSCFIRRK